jgi:hypothetical protein
MVEDWQEDASAPNPFEETALGRWYLFSSSYVVTYRNLRNH